jgi:hypothetical protein
MTRVRAFSFALLLTSLTLSLTLGSQTAGATVLQRVDFDTMARHADLIIYGTVTERFTHYKTRSGPGSRAIVTTTSFDLDHVLKGPKEGSKALPMRGFQLTLTGGVLDGIVMRIPGMPRFEPGERVVLFLKEKPRGGYTVVGFEQGRFRVEEDADGTPIAVRRVRGAAMADLTTGTIDEHDHAENTGQSSHGFIDDLRIPLSLLFERVRSVCKDPEPSLDSQEVTR